MSSKRAVSPHWWVVAVVAAVALVADLASKKWALSALADGATYPLGTRFLTLHLVHNPGAAFSLGSEFTWVFTVLSVGIIAAAAWYSLRVESVWLAVLLGLLIGGALGNLYDRLTRPPAFGQGEVVDFISYGDLFVGNVADIWIVGAAVGVVLWALWPSQGRNQPGSATQEETGETDVEVV